MYKASVTQLFHWNFIIFKQNIRGTILLPGHCYSSCRRVATIRYATPPQYPNNHAECAPPPNSNPGPAIGECVVVCSRRALRAGQTFLGARRENSLARLAKTKLCFPLSSCQVLNSGSVHSAVSPPETGILKPAGTVLPRGGNPPPP